MDPNQPQTPPTPPQTPPPMYIYTPPPAGAPVAAQSGMKPGAAILVAYLLGWIGALYVLATEKNNQFVRFHALQSFVTSVAATVVVVVLNILEAVAPFGIIYLAFSCLMALVWLGYGVGVIITAVQAANGKMIRWPVAAEQADKMLTTFMR